MELWFFVVVLFGALLVAGDDTGYGFLNENATAEARSGARSPCRRLYTFRNLDYEHLKKSLNENDRDQIFTGMAYDPHTGVIFLSSPKVTGRRAAVSFFRVDDFRPGSEPKLTAFPKFSGDAICEDRGRSHHVDTGRSGVDTTVDHKISVDSTHIEDQLLNQFEVVGALRRKLLSTPEEDDDPDALVDDGEYREARGHDDRDDRDDRRSDKRFDKLEKEFERKLKRYRKKLDRNKNKGKSSDEDEDSVHLVLDYDKKKKPVRHDSSEEYHYAKPIIINQSHEKKRPEKKDKVEVTVNLKKDKEKETPDRRPIIIVQEKERRKPEKENVHVTVNLKDKKEQTEKKRPIIIVQESSEHRKPAKKDKVEVTVNVKDKNKHRYDSSEERIKKRPVIVVKDSGERRPAKKDKVHVTVNVKDKNKDRYDSSEERIKKRPVIVVDNSGERRPAKKDKVKVTVNVKDKNKDRYDSSEERIKKRPVIVVEDSEERRRPAKKDKVHVTVNVKDKNKDRYDSSEERIKKRPVIVVEDSEERRRPAKKDKVQVTVNVKDKNKDRYRSSEEYYVKRKPVYVVDRHSRESSEEKIQYIKKRKRPYVYDRFNSGESNERWPTKVVVDTDKGCRDRDRGDCGNRRRRPIYVDRSEEYGYGCRNRFRGDCDRRLFDQSKEEKRSENFHSVSYQVDSTGVSHNNGEDEERRGVIQEKDHSGESSFDSNFDRDSHSDHEDSVEYDENFDGVSEEHSEESVHYDSSFDKFFDVPHRRYKNKKEQEYEQSEEDATDLHFDESPESDGYRSETSQPRRHSYVGRSLLSIVEDETSDIKPAKDFEIVEGLRIDPEKKYERLEKNMKRRIDKYERRNKRKKSKSEQETMRPPIKTTYTSDEPLVVKLIKNRKPIRKSSEEVHRVPIRMDSSGVNSQSYEQIANKSPVKVVVRKPNYKVDSTESYRRRPVYVVEDSVEYSGINRKDITDAIRRKLYERSDEEYVYRKKSSYKKRPVAVKNQSFETVESDDERINHGYSNGPFVVVKKTSNYHKTIESDEADYKRAQTKIEKPKPESPQLVEEDDEEYPGETPFGFARKLLGFEEDDVGGVFVKPIKAPRKFVRILDQSTRPRDFDIVTDDIPEVEVTRHKLPKPVEDGYNLEPWPLEFFQKEEVRKGSDIAVSSVEDELEPWPVQVFSKPKTKVARQPWHKGVYVPDYYRYEMDFLRRPGYYRRYEPYGPVPIDNQRSEPTTGVVDTARHYKKKKPSRDSSEEKYYIQRQPVYVVTDTIKRRPVKEEPVRVTVNLEDKEIKKRRRPVYVIKDRSDERDRYPVKVVVDSDRRRCRDRYDSDEYRPCSYRRPSRCEDFDRSDSDEYEYRGPCRNEYFTTPNRYEYQWWSPSWSNYERSRPYYGSRPYVFTRSLKLDANETTTNSTSHEKSESDEETSDSMPTSGVGRKLLSFDDEDEYLAIESRQDYDTYARHYDDDKEEKPKSYEYVRERSTSSKREKITTDQVEPRHGQKGTKKKDPVQVTVNLKEEKKRRPDSSEEYIRRKPIIVLAESDRRKPERKDPVHVTVNLKDKDKRPSRYSSEEYYIKRRPVYVVNEPQKKREPVHVTVNLEDKKRKKNRPVYVVKESAERERWPVKVVVDNDKRRRCRDGSDSDENGRCRDRFGSGNRRPSRCDSYDSNSSEDRYGPCRYSWWSTDRRRRPYESREYYRRPTYFGFDRFRTETHTDQQADSDENDHYETVHSVGRRKLLSVQEDDDQPEFRHVGHEQQSQELEPWSVELVEVTDREGSKPVRTVVVNQDDFQSELRSLSKSHGSDADETRTYKKGSSKKDPINVSVNLQKDKKNWDSSEEYHRKPVIVYSESERRKPAKKDSVEVTVNLQKKKKPSRYSSEEYHRERPVYVVKETSKRKPAKEPVEVTVNLENKKKPSRYSSEEYHKRRPVYVVKESSKRKPAKEPVKVTVNLENKKKPSRYSSEEYHKRQPVYVIKESSKRKPAKEPVEVTVNLQNKKKPSRYSSEEYYNKRQPVYVVKESSKRKPAKEPVEVTVNLENDKYKEKRKRPVVVVKQSSEERERWPTKVVVDNDRRRRPCRSGEVSSEERPCRYQSNDRWRPNRRPCRSGEISSEERPCRNSGYDRRKPSRCDPYDTSEERYPNRNPCRYSDFRAIDTITGSKPRDQEDDHGSNHGGEVESYESEPATNVGRKLLSVTEKEDPLESIESRTSVKYVDREGKADRRKNKDREESDEFVYFDPKAFDDYYSLIKPKYRKRTDKPSKLEPWPVREIYESSSGEYNYYKVDGGKKKEYEVRVVPDHHSYRKAIDAPRNLDTNKPKVSSIKTAPGVDKTLNEDGPRRLLNEQNPLHVQVDINTETKKTHEKPGVIILEKASDPYPHVSVYAIRIDSCRRLWVLDTGVNQEDFKKFTCKEPSMSVYDISSFDGDLGMRLLQRTKIPEAFYSDASGFQNFVVDMDRSRCDKTVAYIANSLDGSVLTYSFNTEKFKLFRHPSMRPEEKSVTTSMNGKKFIVELGIHGLALGPYHGSKERSLLFNPLAGSMHYAIDGKLAKVNDLDSKDYSIIGSRGCPSVSPSSEYDTKYNVLFYSEPQTNSIKCISQNGFFGTANIATAFKDLDHLNYPHTMTMDTQGHLFVLSNEWPVFAIDGIKPSDMEFSIFRCSPRDLIKDSVCETPGLRSNIIEFIGLKPQKLHRSVDDYLRNLPDPLKTV